MNSGSNPKKELIEIEELTKSVRATQRMTWIATSTLGALLILSIPFYEFGNKIVKHCQSGTGNTYACTRYPLFAFIYWPIASVIAYFIIGYLFIRTSESRGVGSIALPYVVGGIFLIVFEAAFSILQLNHPLLWNSIAGGYLPAGSTVQIMLSRAIGPVGIIAFGLFILAYIERSLKVAVFSLIYLISVLASTATHSHPGRLYFPGLIIPAVILLIGSVGFTRIERAPRLVNHE